MTRDQLRDEWIRRLRSGQYEQGIEQLKVEHSDGLVQYCCLGVACEIVGAREESVANGPTLFDHWFDACYDRAPPSVVDALGLVDRLGRRNDGSREHCLATLNDTGVTFAEISDLLESGQYWKED